MERWHGRNAVVTGASEGIGAAIAVILANHGMKVIGLARRKNLVEALGERVTGPPGSIVARQCDISQSEQIAEVFNWCGQNGGVAVLVNNAGVIFPGAIAEASPDTISEDQLIQQIDVNLKGVVLCSRHAIKSMKDQADGHIININSIAGHYIPSIPTFNVYPATKHAVTAFTLSLANELLHSQSRIRTSSISPGLVATSMGGQQPQKVAALQPEDIANAVIYVLSAPAHVNISEITIEPVGVNRL